MSFSFRSKGSLVQSLLAIFAILLLVFITGCSTEKATTVSTTPQIIFTGEGLTIPKGEITEVAKFYPYEVDGTKMEVIAVKASDGTIKTALNTCQVCFNSGKGYYKQVGNELICQNCKNRFKVDQLEKVKGGCNPVPIMKENKTEDSNNIFVSKDFLANNKSYFANWKK